MFQDRIFLFWFPIQVVSHDHFDVLVLVDYEQVAGDPTSRDPNVWHNFLHIIVNQLVTCVSSLMEYFVS